MKNKHNKKKNLSLTQTTIISIIIIASILVIFFLVFSFSHSSENTIKSKISNLASTYYEDYLYKEISKSDYQEPAEVLKEYENIGLSIVYLRQLLHYKNQTDKETINFLTEHCDENKTTIKFYPEAPFAKNSYRTEYVYSCDF